MAIVQISVIPNKLSQNQKFELHVIEKAIISALQNKKNYIKIWFISEDILKIVFECFNFLPDHSAFFSSFAFILELFYVPHPAIMEIVVLFIE